MNKSIEPLKVPAQYGHSNLLALGKTTDYRMITREAVQNGRESGADKVYLDIHWPYLESDGRYLLAIVDNGRGMTPDQMVELLNGIGVSGDKDEKGASTYGHGVRAMALARNPEGLEFFSKTKGGPLCRIKLVVQDGLVGAERFEVEDEYGDISYEVVEDVSDQEEYWNAWPDMVGESGTIVVLHGDGEDDTVLLNDQKLTFATNFLHKRYWEFSEEILVRFLTQSDRNLWPLSRKHKQSRKGSDKRNTSTRNVKPLSAVVMDMSVDMGEVYVEDAKVTWFILDEDRKSDRDWHDSGFIAAVHKGEVFDFMDGRSSVWEDFGIGIAYRHVVIVVEPDEGLVMQKRERDSLRLVDSGEELPWSDWGQQFREVMPEEIKKFIIDQRNKSTRAKKTERSNELVKIMQKFGVPSFRANATGDESMAEGKGTRFGDGPGGGVIDPDSKTRTRTTRRGKKAATRSRLTGDMVPDVLWMSSEEAKHELDGAAAHYNPVDNYIKADAEYEAIGRLRRMLEGEAEQLPNRVAASLALDDTVLECAEFLLQEKVMSVSKIFSTKPGSPWNGQDFREELSDRALTGSLGHAYTVLVYGQMALKEHYKAQVDKITAKAKEEVNV